MSIVAVRCAIPKKEELLKTDSLRESAVGWKHRIDPATGVRNCLGLCSCAQ